jgi:heptosyltransferase-1
LQSVFGRFRYDWLHRNILNPVTAFFCRYYRAVTDIYRRPFRILLTHQGASRLFHTDSVPVDIHTHAVLRGRLVAAAALGYSVDSPADFSMRAPDVAPLWMPDSPYAAFFHGTARNSKKWPAPCWVEVGRFVAAQGLPVLLPWGSESERQEAKQLAGQIPGARVLPRLSMLEAVELAARARLAVGVDTGLTHIAAAFYRPTVELYCDSPRWKTQGDWSSNIVNLGDLGQPPSAGEVQAAIVSLLSQTNA